MPTRSAIRVLTRITDHHGQTLHFTAESLGGRSGRCKLTFIERDQVPDFEGYQAWFELAQVSATPWPFWRAVRAVEPPVGWVSPPPPPKRHPRELLGHRS